MYFVHTWVQQFVSLLEGALSQRAVERMHKSSFEGNLGIVGALGTARPTTLGLGDTPLRRLLQEFSNFFSNVAVAHQ